MIKNNVKIIMQCIEIGFFLKPFRQFFYTNLFFRLFKNSTFFFGEKINLDGKQFWF